MTRPASVNEQVTSHSTGRSVSRMYSTALYLWGNAAGAAVAGFAFWTLVARMYDTSEVGLGSAALSLVTLLGMFCHLGLGMGLIRFLPEAASRGPRLVNAVFTATAGAAVVASVVFVIGLPLWATSLGFLRDEPLEAAAVIAFAVPATLFAVQSYAFMAIRKPNYILIQTMVVLVTRLAIAALMASFFGAFGIVASWGVAVTLGTLLGFALLVRGFGGYRPALVVDKASVSKLVPFSLSNHVADSVLMAPGLLLPLLVVSLLGAEEAAYFYMAWFLGYLLVSASAFLALSLFAEGSYDPGSLRFLSRNAVVAGLAIATIGAAFLLLAGDRVLLIFGPDYAVEGGSLLRIVALTAIPAAVVNVYLGALRVTKRVGELMVIATAVALTTLTSSLVLLPMMGLAGAGVALGLGQAVGLTVMLGRLLATPDGSVPERMRWLLVTIAGRS